MTGGIITVVPMNAEAAKKMGEDLIKKQGGPMLAKLTGTHMLCLCERLRVCVQVHTFAACPDLSADRCVHRHVDRHVHMHVHMHSDMAAVMCGHVHRYV